VHGHLKPGVTPAQAAADLNSIGAQLAKTYPKEDRVVDFTLARPSLYGEYMGKPVREFLTGLTVLAGLILIAACANLGSLFAARAADRAREVALRLALGSSRRRILRGLFTEAVILSLVGGTVGLLGSVVLLRALSAWQPVRRFPLEMPVNPDGMVYAVALVLAVASGFLFGAMPVRQVLRANPWEIVKAGTAGRTGRRITVRDLLLVVQIAICGVLVTASLVAVRGLVRSIHSSFGFEVQNRILVGADLNMAGYSNERIPGMQKRMVETLEAVPGVERVGLTDVVPLQDSGDSARVYRDNAPDLTPANAAADPEIFKVSPEYFDAAGTALLAGRAFTWHDDASAPRVAVVNPVFARAVFGSTEKALGGYYKLHDGTRIQVVGVAENGKYDRLTEDPRAAMFYPILQAPSSSTWMVVETRIGTQQLEPALRNAMRKLDAGVPLMVLTRYESLDTALFAPRTATVALGVMGMMGALLSLTGIFGMAAYAVSKRMRELGIRMALGAQRRELLQAALGRAVRLLAIGSAAGVILGVLASRVLAFVVYEATPLDPVVLAGVLGAMVLLGLAATWIPAQRALSVDPMILLREE